MASLFSLPIDKTSRLSIVDSVALTLFSMIKLEPPETSEQHDEMKVYDERGYTILLDRKCRKESGWSLFEIERFVSNVFTGSQFSVEAFIYGFCLFLRVTYLDGSFALGYWTWRLALMTCLLVAQKVLEDESPENRCYVRIWTAGIDFHNKDHHTLTVTDINEMEVQLLMLLKFQALVSLEFYQEVCLKGVYFIGLRQNIRCRVRFRRPRF